MAPSQLCCRGERRLLLTTPTREMLSIEEHEQAPKYRLGFKVTVEIVEYYSLCLVGILVTHSMMLPPSCHVLLIQ